MANTASTFEDDLFKKFKLKYYRGVQREHDEGLLSDAGKSLRQINGNDQIPSNHKHSRSFSLCGVCNGNATGCHYGLTTCEGCKEFFRRTVQNNRKYRCYKYSSCIIDHSQRNCCRYCRYQKCLHKGMIISALKCKSISMNRTKFYKCIEEGSHNKAAVKLNELFDINSYDHFDHFSTLDILFKHLRSLMNNNNDSTEESIKKVSHLLIDTFISWYRSLPFSSIVNPDSNQFILTNRWADYIILVIFYFLKINYREISFISYEKCLERVFSYTQTNNLSSVTCQIIDQILHILTIFFDLHITNTEFSLLSILLILQSDQVHQLHFQSTKQVYLKLLHTYESKTFSIEQPYRYNQLLNLLKQIQLVTQILVTHQHFYLPFLLIRN